MHFPRRALFTFAALALVTVVGRDTMTAAVAERDDKGKKPSVSLKVTPPLAIAPANVRAAVEIRGGADDYEEFYCPTIEWDWGDDTKSESGRDCDLYQAGQSQIGRRYSASHTFQSSGNYKVTFRMKRKDKVVALSSVNVQVQPGLTERF